MQPPRTVHAKPGWPVSSFSCATAEVKCVRNMHVLPQTVSMQINTTKPHAESLHQILFPLACAFLHTEGKNIRSIINIIFVYHKLSTASLISL